LRAVVVAGPFTGRYAGKGLVSRTRKVSAGRSGRGGISLAPPQNIQWVKILPKVGNCLTPAALDAFPG